VLALVLIGAGYRLVSGSTAGAVAVYWPAPMYGKIASRIYITWCVAAVTLPVPTGHLFDLTSGYHATVLIAGCETGVLCHVFGGVKRRAVVLSRARRSLQGSR
jgi:hypothetical protein